MNRRVLLVGALLIIPMLVLLARSLGRDPHKIDSPLVGRQAPSFSLKEVGASHSLALASFRGKPVVLNFWATWCVPCYAEHRVLAEIARERSDFAFLGVVYDDKEERIVEFLGENGKAYPTVVDSQGKTAIAYGVYGVPETFFIASDGLIAAKYTGPLTRNTLLTFLDRIRSRG